MFRADDGLLSIAITGAHARELLSCSCLLMSCCFCSALKLKIFTIFPCPLCHHQLLSTSPILIVISVILMLLEIILLLIIITILHYLHHHYLPPPHHHHHHHHLVPTFLPPPQVLLQTEKGAHSAHWQPFIITSPVAKFLPFIGAF